MDSQIIHAFELFGTLLALVSVDSFEVGFTINFLQKAGVALETFECLNFVDTYGNFKSFTTLIFLKTCAFFK